MRVFIASALALGVVPGSGALGADPSSDGAYGAPIAAETLDVHRAGDVDVLNLAISNQQQHAVNAGNTINAGGDVIAGAITVHEGSLSDMHGMSNVVLNSGQQANVMGQITLQLILP